MTRFAASTKIAAAALVGLTLASTVPARAGSRNDGAAVAAGVIGGLVIGGLAASAASNYYEPAPRYYPELRPDYRPAYGYGGGYDQGYRGQGYRGYERAPRYAQRPRCWVETQTFYTRYGRPVSRDIEVCR